MLELRAGPTSVLAVKYRYLPPLSNTALAASLMPSLTWCDFLPSSEYRKTACRWLFSCIVYASHLPSGDHDAEMRESKYGLVSTFVCFSVARSTYHRFVFLSV